MTQIDRRTLLAAPLFMAAGVNAKPAFSAAQAPDFWEVVAQDYDVTQDVLNLENGNWGIMAKPVLRAYQGHVARVNQVNSYYVRRTFWGDVQSILARLAVLLGVKPDEIALTRNATEAMQALILGYRKLGQGDTALYADLDYGSMQQAMEALARQRGATCIKLSVPENPTHQGLIEFYIHAMEANPRVKLLLLTHISHRTGLKMPVTQIIAAAKARGVDVIVDAAHSWGQVEMTVPGLGADFVGLNLHKWMGAPLGVGLMVVRKERLDDIAPHPLAAPNEHRRVSGRVHTGTMNFAAILTIADALDYHLAIGAKRKAQRLAALRMRWVSQVADHPKVSLLTPLTDARLSAGITALRIADVPADALARRLLGEHGIFTVKRTGIAAGDAVRITPALYNSMADMDRCAAALLAIAERP